jgi:ankyrin repeat protein
LLIIQYLAETCGADLNVNATDKNGETPLHWACWCGHVPVVQFLVETVGASPLAVNSNGRMPLESAKVMDRKGVVEYLESRPLAVAIVDSPTEKVEPTKKVESHELFEAVRNGNIDLVRRLVEQKCDVDTVDQNGRTPLHMALARGYANIACYLLETGCAKVDITN